ncbi:hypothetical protein AVEN_185917-1 [Araneus ventricosus]|uniref:Uncharacterized protein n=1 Tax=Araneus ventricosus TaxID=182803 RepID=A0A4Y2QA14_ARAVE|nr:hypothetical protein AVEN_521-1 [Araneus ventricosus]GBN59903.1 hypothetical protein AVEN_250445-1 [Araneus ventricosus]GBN59956.1 hypothetical protein AVEN_76086-1 [Araneus ventricosus]GBN59990.1 hypothetical protein AVEN_185917-1 [Araneus ventricosus]
MYVRMLNLKSGANILPLLWCRSLKRGCQLSCRLAAVQNYEVCPVASIRAFNITKLSFLTQFLRCPSPGGLTFKDNITNSIILALFIVELIVLTSHRHKSDFDPLKSVLDSRRGMGHVFS